ncbi:MAG TPA: hypothetical protein VN259_09020 [Xanthomonadales bacterium]|nr:hypothetical protein [Xanthomonadales bacterium]
MSGGVDISALLAGAQAFAENLIPFLVGAAAVVVGLVVIFSAIRNVYQMGATGRASASGNEVGYGGVAMKLLVGGLLLRFAATLQDTSQLLFGVAIQSHHGVLAYAPLPAQAGMWRQVLEVVLLWVVMIGWVGAFRGLMLWNSAANGGGSGGSSGDLFWRGLWHLIGGATAVNLTGAVSAFLGK